MRRRDGSKLIGKDRPAAVSLGPPSSCAEGSSRTCSHRRSYKLPPTPWHSPGPQDLHAARERGETPSDIYQVRRFVCVLDIACCALFHSEKRLVPATGSYFPDQRLPFTDCRLLIHWLRVTDYRLPITANIFHITDYGLPVINYWLMMTGSRFPDYRTSQVFFGLKGFNTSTKQT